MKIMIKIMIEILIYLKIKYSKYIMKVALLIPSTSKGRDWKTFQETYLFKHTVKTFLQK